MNSETGRQLRSLRVELINGIAVHPRFMSLISDALNKAQRERASAAETSFSSAPSKTPNAKPASARNLVLVVANSVALIAMGIAVFFVLRPPGVDAVKLGRTDRVAVASTPRSMPSGTTANDTPMAHPNQNAEAAAPSTEYDLGGMTAIGSNTLLSISRRSDKRSIWIPVGKTVGEVTAISYDAATDRAVIRVEGRLLTIRMRDAAFGAPVSVQAAE